MKKQLTILFLFIGISIFAQSEETLKDGAKKMYQASYNMNIESVLDYTYPKIFEMANKEQLGQALKSSFDNANFNIRMVLPEVTFKIGQIKEVDNKKVSLITYASAMRMTFVQKMTPADAKEMLEALKQSLPSKKITYEPNTNSYFIEGTDTMIGIADELTNNEWKYITYDKVQRPKLVNVLGEKLLKAVGL